MLQPGASGIAGRWPLATGTNSIRYASLDAIKAFALLWICLVHWTERLFGGWYIANPDNSWPPLADRIAQLMPVSGHGIWDIPLSLLLGFGRAGDQGVQLFLIVSGFGLTWGLLQSKHGVAAGWSAFYRRRLSRIYPEYWIAHLMVLAGALATGRALQSDTGFFFSLLGIRITSDLLYGVSPPWWYIGLILQLYAVYPLLWYLLLRLGRVRFLLLTLGVSLAIRTIGLWVFADLAPEWNYLDAWARGAVFVTRLPEFTFGMALAAWAQSSPESWMQRLRTGGMLTLAAIGYVLATALSAFLLGNGIAIFLLGACLFVLLLALFETTLVHRPVPMRLTRWLSDHTYALFLVHYAAIVALIPRGAPLDGRLALRTGVAIFASIVAALLLEFLTARARGLAAAIARQSRARRWRLAGAAVTIWLLLIGGELWVRADDPQEVNGWGERPSLEPHPTFGWRLIPNRTTHLRWLGYDYEVTANALGFPGPLYPAERTPGSLRIMTTGDAFTGAEGVDTPKAWPRLLEHALARRLGGRAVEVQNFGVTGYGPNQYAAIAEAFVPMLKPDALVMTMFVNELNDVATSNEAFRHSIGFGRTGADDLYAVLTLGHLATLASRGAAKLVFERVFGRPDPADANFSQLGAFRADGSSDLAAKAMLRDRLEQVRRIAEANGVHLLLLLVPANVQVCASADLDVYPRNVNLKDGERFDLERPQRVLAETATALGIAAVDLRPVLTQAGRCLYHPRNMHWLPEAHERVADFVADLLAREQANSSGSRTSRRRTCALTSLIPRQQIQFILCHGEHQPAVGTHAQFAERQRDFPDTDAEQAAGLQDRLPALTGCTGDVLYRRDLFALGVVDGLVPKFLRGQVFHLDVLRRGLALVRDIGDAGGCLRGSLYRLRPSRWHGDQAQGEEARGYGSVLHALSPFRYSRRMRR